MADFNFPQLNSDLSFPKYDEGIVAAHGAKGYNEQGILVPVKDREIHPGDPEYDKDVNGITSPNLHRRIDYDDTTDELPVRSEGEGLHDIQFTVQPEDWKELEYETTSGRIYHYMYCHYTPGISYQDYISGNVVESDAAGGGQLYNTGWMVETDNNYIIIRTGFKITTPITYHFYIEYFEEITKYRREVFIGKYGKNSYRLERIHYHEEDSTTSEIP